MIEGVIGKKASAATVRDYLAIHGDGDLDVELNSEGGVITEGVAMYHALRKHPGNVTVRVTGLAASMGSIVLQAGDKRIISPGAYVMIHMPSTGAEGEAGDLRRNADLLDKMREDMLDIYEARTGQPREKLVKMMAEETWLNAEEALALGFVDEIDAMAVTTLRAVAESDLRAVAQAKFKNAPEAVRNAGKSGQVPAAQGTSKMTKEEEEELRAQVAALKAENEKMKARAEESEEDDDTEGAGDDEPHSEEEEDEESAKAAAVAEIDTFVARGYIEPKKKAAALAMKPKAWGKYRETLLKMGPVVPTGQVRAPGAVPKPGEEQTDPNEPTAAEKAYMKASGKPLATVRGLGALPKSQVLQVAIDLNTRKAV